MFARYDRQPITDPIRHAESRLGIPFLQKEIISAWEGKIARHTTGEFSHIGKGFKRHCGPTAITNALLTWHHAHRFLPRPVDARQIFSEVSALGRSKGIYWNTDIFGRFGGTYDILTQKYIRDCFRKYGVSVPVRSNLLSTKKQMLAALDAGKLLYLQVYRHPIYGSHHLLCYGYTKLRSIRENKEEIYMLLADGWSSETRYLWLPQRGACHFYEIG